MDWKKFLNPTVWKLLLFPFIFFPMLSLPGVSSLPNNAVSYFLLFALSYIGSCTIMKVVCKLEKRFEKADLKTLATPNARKAIFFLIILLLSTWDSYCISCTLTYTKADAYRPSCSCDPTKVAYYTIVRPLNTLFEIPARQFSMGLYWESFSGLFGSILVYLIFVIVPLIIFYLSTSALLFALEVIFNRFTKKKSKKLRLKK